MIDNAVEWADDPDQPPRLHEATAWVTVGKAWLKAHFPEAQTRLFARRMLGINDVTQASWLRVCNEVKDHSLFATNEQIATDLIRAVLK